MLAMNSLKKKSINKDIGKDKNKYEQIQVQLLECACDISDPARGYLECKGCS